jgi:hypothetical protein
MAGMSGNVSLPEDDLSVLASLKLGRTERLLALWPSKDGAMVGYLVLTNERCLFMGRNRNEGRTSFSPEEDRSWSLADLDDVRVEPEREGYAVHLPDSKLWLWEGAGVTETIRKARDAFLQGGNSRTAPNAHQVTVREVDSSRPQRQCPYCGRVIGRDSPKCERCGLALPAFPK